MNTCSFCVLTDGDRHLLLFENDFWSVYLADKQDYVGRCIIVCRIHREALSELAIDEWISLKSVIDSLEALLKCELGATAFNWRCLMNDADKVTSPRPHVHFHVRPRYAAPVCIDGAFYADEEFAHHYNNHAADQLDDAAKIQLFTMLKAKIDDYFVHNSG